MDIDLKAVIQFVHLARTRSFSRSAAELGVSQPWLSARIRRLEERLGCPLFTRTTRHVALSPEGERLLSSAMVLANSAAAFEVMARDLRGKAGRRLRLGSPPYASQVGQRVELIERYAAATRTVVELDIGWSRALIEQLHRGELDAAFLAEPFDQRGLETLPFCTLKLMALLRSDDPLAAAPVIHPADLAGRCIGVFTRTLHPHLFDLLTAPLIAVGATVMELPEVLPSLLTGNHHHEPHVLGQIESSSAVAGPLEQGLVRRPLMGLPRIELKLARRVGLNSAACQHFWAMAG